MSPTIEELFARSDALIKRSAKLSAEAAERSRYTDMLRARSTALVVQIRELIERLPPSGRLHAPAPRAEDE